MTDKTSQASESTQADIAAKPATKSAAKRTAGVRASAAKRPQAARRAPDTASSASPSKRVEATAQLPSIEPAVTARKRVNAREVAARQETTAVLADIARRYTVGESGEAHEALRSVIEELSPDCLLYTSPSPRDS